MALNILAPEWPLAKAWSEYCSVSSFVKKFEQLRKELGEDDVPWTRAHVYLANMGGFGIKFENVRVQSSMGDTSPSANTARANSALREQTVTDTIQENSPQPDAQPSNIAQSLTRNNPEQPATHSTQEDNSQPDTQRTNITRRLTSNVPERLQDNPGLIARPGFTSTSNTVSPNDAPPPENHPSEQTEDQTEIREIPTHDLPAPPLPESIRSNIRDWANQERFAGTDTQNSIGRASKRVGQIPWNLDNSNTKAVQSATLNVNLNHFRTAAEKHRFLVGNVVWFDNLHALQGDLWILDAHQLLLVREMGIINHLPLLTEDDLDGKNRADALVTLLAIGQIVWLIIQLVERLLHYHRTTQLEIVTFAFSICAAIIFFLVWYKPKDVQTSILVKAVRYPTPEELIRIAVAGPYIFARKRGKRHSIWIPNNAIHWESAADGARVGPMKQFNLGCASALIIFGAVHCIAWNFTFPTLVEKRIWQISSVLSVALVPLTILLLVMYWRFAETKDGRSLKAKRGSSVIFLLFTSLFVFSRLFIIVEAFRSLAYLPSGAFLTTWANGWPHIG
jgi:hypothetical protein